MEIKHCRIADFLSLLWLFTVLGFYKLKDESLQIHVEHLISVIALNWIWDGIYDMSYCIWDGNCALVPAEPLFKNALSQIDTFMLSVKD